ncbi:MAG: helix-turn-helix domain-containing protein [Candidatus Marinimicrobia bacterium]|nr:helix-turn-helix domain-containing protein [Candidatus Neomarinimicrobiota bacterium]
MIDLKGIRKSLGFTQADFAEELRIDRTSLSDYERGKTTMPPYVEKLIELYLEVHGETGLLYQVDSLNSELKKLDRDAELDAGRRRRSRRNPLPGIEGA